MEEKEKDSYIQFRISNDTKKRFQEITKREAINTSELFRQWIEKYIQDNQPMKEVFTRVK
jgi:ribbon-helix-helix protein, copG family